MEPIHSQRTRRQPAQIIEVHLTQLAHRPHACRARNRIEPFEVFHTAAGAVVISPHHGGEIFAGPIEHAVGIRPVTGQIAAADNLVIPAARVFNNGFEGFPVAVQIAHYEIAHGFSWDTSGTRQANNGNLGRRADPHRQRDRA